MKSTHPADYQNVARAVAAMPAGFPTGHRIPRHAHQRAQLLLASGGALEITADENIWVVPSGRAVWIPADVEHAVYVISATTIHSLYIDAAAQTRLRPDCQVLAISRLLHALVSAAMDIPLEYEQSGRDGHVITLILLELEGMKSVPLHAPMPRDARLRTICQAIIDDPARSDTLTEWGAGSGRHLERWPIDSGLKRG